MTPVIRAHGARHSLMRVSGRSVRAGYATECPVLHMRNAVSSFVDSHMGYGVVHYSCWQSIDCAGNNDGCGDVAMPCRESERAP
eukprot:COSAG02_NODE_1130_length_14395_cov_10.634373_3_plen_84_part_00